VERRTSVGTGDPARRLNVGQPPSAVPAERKLGSRMYDEPTEADRYQMIRTYFEMLLEEGMPEPKARYEAVRLVVHHGVPGGATLRKAIYEAKRGAEILGGWKNSSKPSSSQTA